MLKKKVLLILCAFVALSSCHEKKAPTGAEQLYEKISSAYEEGRDSACLEAIKELRTKYPKAIEERKKALVIYQNATLRIAQRDLERTMRRLDSVKVKSPKSRECDSLQWRFNGLCLKIRYIHKCQKENGIENGNVNGNQNKNGNENENGN